ncbi:MAG TPA: hypothetical protein PLA43_06410 [Bryobacteraceae bacterium]|nr:hypothetical protein [Bryobacteraceae bacterium]HOQ45703.1 hypothetical protein [Bryobacteraceae bacterium]HPQ14286.1 hypothetical protein [Bryobacteraceae bacterium]HPU71571.1 hypothetical protein [Bryobacteraceae bacterium]
MIAALQQILERTLERLGSITTAYLPPLLAGLVIFLAALLFAKLARLLLLRVTNVSGFDQFLSQSGLSSMLGRSGRLRAARLVASTVFWGILLAGALTALSAFNTELTSRIIETVVFLLPKLITAGAIVLAGVWLGQYLGRSVLVWACNDGIPYPRALATAVRLFTVFVSVVVAADHLDFARTVFLAAFITLVGGMVLAASIAVGIGAHDAVQRRVREAQQQPAAAQTQERSLWDHL